MIRRMIKNIRARLGLSCTDFARAVGVSASQVSRWEAGLQRPGYPAAKRIAALLDDITIDELMAA